MVDIFRSFKFVKYSLRDPRSEKVSSGSNYGNFRPSFFSCFVVAKAETLGTLRVKRITKLRSFISCNVFLAYVALLRNSLSLFYRYYRLISLQKFQERRSILPDNCYGFYFTWKRDCSYTGSRNPIVRQSTSRNFPSRCLASVCRARR